MVSGAFLINGAVLGAEFYSSKINVDIYLHPIYNNLIYRVASILGTLRASIVNW